MTLLQSDKQLYVSDYDYMTQCVETLRSEIYGFEFYKEFFNILDNQIHLFNYKYDQYTLYVTIDQNRCRMLDGFNHNKVFYSRYIDSAYDAIIKKYARSNIKVGDILDNLNAKHIPTYKLISYTPILSNQIVIYF